MSFHIPIKPLAPSVGNGLLDRRPIRFIVGELLFSTWLAASGVSPHKPKKLGQIIN